MFMEHMANGLNGMQELFLFRKKKDVWIMLLFKNFHKFLIGYI